MKTRTVLISLVSVMFVAAMTAVPVAASPGTHSCGITVGLGIPGVLSVSLGDGIGGCTLVVTEGDTTVVDFSASAGCSISADQNGDGFGESFEQGDSLQPGSNVFATCDIGTVDGFAQIELE